VINYKLLIFLTKNIFLKKKKRKNQNKNNKKLWHATSLIPDRALQKTIIAGPRFPSPAPADDAVEDVD
jgi:hypothetical protein